MALHPIDRHARRSLLATQASLYGDALSSTENTLARVTRIVWDSFHHNFGAGLQAIGKLAEAINLYQSAIKLQPDFAMSYNNLGNGCAIRPTSGSDYLS